jgi:hypothetical protein
MASPVASSGRLITSVRRWSVDATMITFRLTDRRPVNLLHLHLLSSALTLGSRRSEVEAGLPAWISKHYGGGRTEPRYTVRWPDSGTGSVLCVGMFNSTPLTLNASEGFSTLIVCWFIENVERPLREIVEAGLCGLDWNANAEDLSGW